ncbi:MAG: Polysialic acid transport protein KpsD precursor [Syntrophorhabdaceae bacterium PtaU1.Bin034]|nr:MAG: Polysialic acid transport protein KpsD precursor [Syntrophorhabdaceae bacterium PtaU1.Bin034]
MAMIGLFIKNNPLAKAILSLSLAVGLVACAAPAAHNPDRVMEMESRTGGTAAAQADYKIQAGDQLDIKFFYNSELNEALVVRPDGRISLQLLGAIKVQGLTPSELEAMLKKRYVSRLAKPEVTVIVRSFNMHKVFVDGHVVKPGGFPLVGFMTVMQSISQAGGLRDGARKKEILVIRRDDLGKPTVLKVNLDKAMEGDMEEDIYLAPFDVVFVPKSAIGNVNQFVDLYIRRNLPINTNVGYAVPNY